MMAGKWNYQTKKYSLYKLPKGCRLYDEDLTKKVACCQCGEEKEFGDMYTSKEIHNYMGLGYPVCETCYQLELERENKNGK